MEFRELKRNLKKDFSGFEKLKLAILADSDVQMLAIGIRGHGYERELDIEVIAGDIDQIDMQILAPDSSLYESAPDEIFIFESSQKLMAKFQRLESQERVNFAKDHLKRLEEWLETLQARHGGRVIYANFVELEENVYGHFANKVADSFISQLREINFRLTGLAQKRASLHILDFSLLNNRHGHAKVFSPKLHFGSAMAMDVNFLPQFSKALVDVIGAQRGKFTKCVILDLDNTLWGGVIGDDGIEGIKLGGLGIGKAFSEFQWWLKRLLQRGILLAVCSKNEETNAREVFEKHPEMVLSLDDIAVFVANWEDKVHNIKHVQSVLNIGFDTMVFLDDNAFERGLVREHLPEIKVPELPEDPADYADHLESLGLFEAASVSKDDADRTKRVQSEAQRQEMRQSFTDMSAYLKSLDMKSKVEEATSFNTSRISQLTQRSNQYNLRTQRYDAKQIEDLQASKDHLVLSFTLQDKFGDSGLVSIVIVDVKDNFFIDTWLMSCRVLKRDLEKFVLNELIAHAKASGKKEIIGEYLPTKKNSLVKDHYKDLGFKEKDGKWVLLVKGYQPFEVSIERIDINN